MSESAPCQVLSFCTSLLFMWHSCILDRSWPQDISVVLSDDFKSTGFTLCQSQHPVTFCHSVPYCCSCDIAAFQTGLGHKISLWCYLMTLNQLDLPYVIVSILSSPAILYLPVIHLHSRPVLVTEIIVVLSDISCISNTSNVNLWNNTI